MTESTLILGKAGDLSQDPEQRPQLWLLPATDANGDEIPGGYILCVNDKESGQGQQDIIANQQTIIANQNAQTALLQEIVDLLAENNQQNQQKITLLSVSGSGNIL